MSSFGWLQAKASDMLKSNPETDEDGNPTAATTGRKRAALMNMAKSVQEQAGKGMGTSKDYLSSVMAQVSTYTNDASENATENFTEAKEAANAHLAEGQENLNKAIEQGKAQGKAQIDGNSTTEGTTDPELPAIQEPESFEQGKAERKQVGGDSTTEGTADRELPADPETESLEQGKAQSKGQVGGDLTAEGTTDRELPADPETESLSFPFNIVAYVVSCCVSKTGASASSDAAATSTSNGRKAEGDGEK